MKAAGQSVRQDGAAAGRSRGWWYPWLFVGGLGLVVAVNGVLITVAIDSFSGLQTTQPYERGLEYNRILASARAQEALGWQVTLDVTPVGEGGLPQRVDIEARFLDPEGRGLDGMAVEALLLRPAARGHDLEVPLVGRGGGRYVASPDLPLRGQWELRIVAAGKDMTWQSSRRILVP